MSLEATLDRLHSRAVSNTWLQFFTAVVRVLLALAFIPSGLTKVLGNPFTTLPETTSVGFFFAGFFQAQGYYRFVGISQLTASALLLFRSTTTLGAALYLPIIVNIFVITISVGFQGTPVVTGLMLLANIYLICWDYDRWKGVLPGFSRNAEIVKSRHVPGSTIGLLLLSAAIGLSSAFAGNLARLGRGGSVAMALLSLAAGAAVGFTALWRHIRAR